MAGNMRLGERSGEMLTEKKRRAVELLFEGTEAEAAVKLRVSRQTLEEWMEEREFQQAVSRYARATRRATSRMLSSLYLEACRELNVVIHERDDRNRHKAMVDILKAGGLLKEGPVDEEEIDTIDEILARYGEESEEEETGEDEHRTSNIQRRTGKPENTDCTDDPQEDTDGHR
jgi:hypothetical protein